MLTQTVSVCYTCENCPMFQNYKGTRGRGTCKLFDKITRTYHEMGQDCRNELEEVIVTLHSIKQEIDLETGNLEPKRVITLSFFMKKADVNLVSVLSTFDQYQKDFPGMFVHDFFSFNTLDTSFQEF